MAGMSDAALGLGKERIAQEATERRTEIAETAPELVATAKPVVANDFQFSHPALIAKETALSEVESTTANPLTWSFNGVGNALASVLDNTRGTEYSVDPEVARKGINELKNFLSENPDLETTIGQLIGDKGLFETMTADGNSEWLQEQIRSMIPEGAGGADVPEEVRAGVVSYLEAQSGNQAFRDNLKLAIENKNTSFFEDMKASVTSVAIDAGLADFASKGEAQANLVSTIEATPSLTAAIDRLATENPEKFTALMDSLGSGDVDPNDEDAVAAQTVQLQTAQMMLENPVLADQMTSIINNMSDPTLDVNPEDLTALQVAATELKNVATDLGPMGMIFDEDNKFADARIKLESAYENVGLSERDSHIAIEQAAVMLINDKLSTFDNFGDHINAAIDGALESFGKDSFIGSFLISTGLMTEAQLENFVTMIQDFISQVFGDFSWANLDLLGEGVLGVDGLSQWIESTIDIDTSERPDNNPTPNPYPDIVEPSNKGDSPNNEEFLGAEYRSPVSEMGRTAQFDFHSGGEAGDVYGAAQQTVSLNKSFEPAMNGVVMTPAEVKEVVQTAPAVAANSQMTLSA